MPQIYPDYGQSLDLQIRIEHLKKPVPEYRFHPVRRWRIDRAYPDEKIAIEIEGGTWVKGRHTRGKGYENDCRKYNTLTAMGWKIYRYTPEMIEDGTAIKDLISELNSPA